MSMNDEIREIFSMILNHPDEINQLNFYVRLNNGTIFRYHVDRKKEAALIVKEEERKHRIEEKMKKIESKRKKLSDQ
jgi:hypothetical protein